MYRYPSIHLSICSSTHVSIFPSIHLSIYPSICLFINLINLLNILTIIIINVINVINIINIISININVGVIITVNQDNFNIINQLSSIPYSIATTEFPYRRRCPKVLYPWKGSDFGLVNYCEPIPNWLQMVVGIGMNLLSAWWTGDRSGIR